MYSEVLGGGVMWLYLHVLSLTLAASVESGIENRQEGTSQEVATVNLD